MSFGEWHLHVKAIGYRSSDPEDKVVAFYKNAMAQYGDVLTCKNKTAIGEPSQTSQGLTCSNGHEYEVTMSVDNSKKHMSVSTPQISGAVKLLAGSPENQHIVEFNPTPDGTKFPWSWFNCRIAARPTDHIPISLNHAVSENAEPMVIADDCGGCQGGLASTYGLCMSSLQRNLGSRGVLLPGMRLAASALRRAAGR